MEFSRKNLATLREIKLKARQEVGFEINFASPTLDQDLEMLSGMEVSDALLQMITSVLPEKAEESSVEWHQNESKLRYRGQVVTKTVREDIEESVPVSQINKTSRLRYRGQLVEA